MPVDGTVAAARRHRRSDRGGRGGRVERRGTGDRAGGGASGCRSARSAHCVLGRHQRLHGLVAAEATKVVTQRSGRRVAHRRILGEQFGDDGLVGAGDVGDDLHERLRRVVDLLVGDADRVLARERRPARDHLVHHDAERVQVAARIGLRTLGLLGGEVGGGAHDRADLGEVGLGGRVHRPGDAEVGDLHLAVRADEDVRRLDVAVGHVVVVGEAERGGHFAGDLGRLLGGELLVRRQDLGEGAALHLFHGDEVGAFVLAPVVHADDVRVREAGRRLRLATETLDEVGIGGELGKQHLDRHLAVEEQVARGEDVGHASAPDPFVDLISVIDDRRLAVVRHREIPVSSRAPEPGIEAPGKVSDGIGVTVRHPPPAVVAGATSVPAGAVPAGVVAGTVDGMVEAPSGTVEPAPVSR